MEPTADLDNELVALMKRAGCTVTTCLLGSVEQGMQERLRRPGGMPEIARACQLLYDLEEGVVTPDTDMLEPQFHLSPHVDRDWLKARNRGLQEAAHARTLAVDPAHLAQHRRTFLISRARPEPRDRRWCSRRRRPRG